MGRPRLTEAEREERRRERSRRSFSEAAYKHYDPRTEGYGSTNEWINAAEAMTGGRGVLKATARPTGNPDLALLFLDEMPTDITALKKAFHNALFVAHPDHGGTSEATRLLLAAFHRLTRYY